MRIAILSRIARLYSTRRLREAARSRGHQVDVLDTLGFSIYVEPGHPELSYRGKRLKKYDAIIPRISPGITYYGLAVLRQFEQMGVYKLNPAAAIARSRDKLQAMQILSRHRIGMPRTAFVCRKEDVLPAIEEVGGAPVIIKLLEGTQGVGVILAENVKVAQAIIETLQSKRQHVLIQKFVKESKGIDVRAFVVGNRVVAAMRRRSDSDDFRSNIHLGGTGEAIQLAPEYEKTAIRAAQILGLRMAGVDMLETHDGPQVLEVNSSPGLEGIENATGIDIASAIIEEIEKHVLFPEIDLRERLALSAGHGIVELTIHQVDEFVDRSLAEINLFAKRIRVLTILRGNDTIPNPTAETIIRNGDTLVCFGDLLELRSLIPSRLPRKKQHKK